MRGSSQPTIVTAPLGGWYVVRYGGAATPRIAAVHLQGSPEEAAGAVLTLSHRGDGHAFDRIAGRAAADVVTGRSADWRLIAFAADGRPVAEYELDVRKAATHRRWSGRGTSEAAGRYAWALIVDRVKLLP